MKKTTVEFEFLPEYREMLDAHLPEALESIELLDMIKMDFRKGLKVALTRIAMKEGHTLDDLRLPGRSGVLSVLTVSGNGYVCLVEGSAIGEMFGMGAGLWSNFDLSVKWDVPSIMTRDRLVLSLVGDEADLRKFLNALKVYGTIKKISFKKVAWDGNAILYCLTDKQREIMVAAQKYGYYRRPRQISSAKLAKMFGISRATTLEHIRKAEQRIMEYIFTGY